MSITGRSSGDVWIASRSSCTWRISAEPVAAHAIREVSWERGESWLWAPLYDKEYRKASTRRRECFSLQAILPGSPEESFGWGRRQINHSQVLRGRG